MSEKPEEMYPEHVKLQKIVDKSQAIGAFLDWLQTSEGVHLTVRDDRGFCGIPYDYTDDEGNQFVEVEEEDYAYKPVNRTIEEWLALYFGIDQRKISQEKAEMLEHLRAGLGT